MENIHPVQLKLYKRNYSDAVACDDSELIHQHPMMQIMQIWERMYKKASIKDSNEDVNRQEDSLHCHNAISIFASRGAGKTTFLLSFLKKIKEEKGAGAICLNMIDPSLMESKQHPFVNVVAGIQDIVQEYIDEKECQNSRGKTYAQYLDFEERYKKLLQALPFVDGIGTNDAYNDWDDCEFVAELGMKQAINSINLRKRFHEYVDSALELIGKTCFVIPFDDIDTDFKKGFELLEVIRKYLTSPKVIVILTGDLNLYSNLVRKHYWEYFPKNYLEKESEIAGQTTENFATMIDHLENQYLIKVLKPENRIMLKTVREYLEMDKIPIEVVMTEGEKYSPLIQDVYNNMLINKIVPNSTQSKDLVTNIEQFLTRLSMRVQMRILTLLYELNGNNSSNEVDYVKKLSEGLLSIFSNDINQKASNASKLKKGNVNYTEELLTFLVHTESLHTRKNFLPESDDETLNKALFAISTEFNYLLKTQKHLVFDYWLRISYVQASIEQICGKKYDDVSEFLEFTLMNTDTGLSKSLGLSLAYCNHQLNRQKMLNKEAIQRTMPGTIFIGSKTPLLRGGIPNILSLLPMVGTVDNSMNESVFLSVYKLFAIAHNMLVEFKGFNKISDIKDFTSQLNRLSQYRSFIEPQTLSANNITRPKREFDDLSYKINFDDEESFKWKSFFYDFSQWHDMPFKNVSLQLLDKIFTRFYFSAIHISQHNEGKSPVELLSLNIIALLNATLVENALAYGVNMNLNNIGDLEMIFIENIQTYRRVPERKQREMTLFNWLKTCPVFYWFLNPLIRKLMEEEDPEKAKTLTAILQYSRIIVSKEGIDRQLKTLRDNIAEYEKVLVWIADYNELKREEENLAMFERFFHRNITVKSSVDRFATYWDEKTKISERVAELGNKLVPLKTSLLSATLTKETEKNHIQNIEHQLKSELIQKKETKTQLEEQEKLVKENLALKKNSLVERFYLQLISQDADGIEGSIYKALSELTERIK